MASLNLDVSLSMCSRWNNSAFPSPGIEDIAEHAAIPDAKAENGRPARLPAIRFLQVRDARLNQYEKFNGPERSRWLSA
jgi:hypothetical protein